MASTYLTKTYTTQPTNGKIGTFSFWFKFSKLSASGDRYLFSTYENSNNRTLCKFNTDGKFELQTTEGANAGLRYDTTRVFRDTNSWYNIVIATDTTQSTAANRVKIYVNGVQETSFTTANNPAQNLVPHFLYGAIQKWIGVYGGGGANNWDGLMSHVSYIDGTQELPTIFGETDSTTGEWKIKTTITPSSAWGTNGYWILKDGNTVTDSSTNSNAWTVGGGTLTKTEDNPSNVFATWNPLMPQSANYSHGNTSVNQTTDADYRPIYSTVATPTTGKFYAEFKAVSGFDNINKAVGFIDVDLPFDDNAHIEAYSASGSYGANGRASYNGTTDTSVPQYTNGDIIGIALDLDNGKAYYHKNGTYINSGNPTTGSNGYTVTTGKSYVFAAIVINQGGANLWSANFGNGYFGTTAVASAGTNASGNGIFEYDTPTGYTALSTKGLNL